MLKRAAVVVALGGRRRPDRPDVTEVSKATVEQIRYAAAAVLVRVE